MKEFLSHHNISFIEYDISTDQAARDHLVFELNSHSTPTIVIGDDVIPGFDLDKLKTVLKVD